MTNGRKDMVPAASEFLLYAAPDGAVKVRVLLKDETVLFLRISFFRNKYALVHYPEGECSLVMLIIASY